MNVRVDANPLKRGIGRQEVAEREHDDLSDHIPVHVGDLENMRVKEVKVSDTEAAIADAADPPAPPTTPLPKPPGAPWPHVW